MALSTPSAFVSLIDVHSPLASVANRSPAFGPLLPMRTEKSMLATYRDTAVRLLKVCAIDFSQTSDTDRDTHIGSATHVQYTVCGLSLTYYPR
jgi:hypothetical protein